MDCLKPLEVYYCGKCIAKDGVVSPRLVFSYRDALAYWLGLVDNNYFRAVELLNDNTRLLTCGKCAACQIRKRKDMSVRIAHETRMHEDCCFVTLTYNDDNVPVCDEFVPVQTLVPSHVQKFIKRLRRHLEYLPKKQSLAKKRDHVNHKIRYFCVGEYGTKSKRPHYHLIIFGWKPSDQTVWKLQKGYTVNRSAQIEKLWKYGFSTVCEVNAGVARYCARYVTKKFVRLDNPDLEDSLRVPEFVLQSTRAGGIGATWLLKYQGNLRQGFVNVSDDHGRVSKCCVPKYYYDRLRKINLPLWLELRDERLDWISKNREVCQDLSDIDFDRVNRLVACAIDRYFHEAEREHI